MRSQTEYAVTLRAKIAGIDNDYEGEILLSMSTPPDSCTLVFEGKGRAACLAIGTAQINLSAKDDGTRVAYTVAGMAGGKLAECGESLLLKAGEKIIEKGSSLPSLITWLRCRASRPLPLLRNPSPAACRIRAGPGCW